LTLLPLLRHSRLFILTFDISITIQHSCIRSFAFIFFFILFVFLRRKKLLVQLPFASLTIFFDLLKDPKKTQLF